MVGTIAIAIAKAQPFENQTIWNLTFKKSRFQMVGFQIPTVLLKAGSFENIDIFYFMVKRTVFYSGVFDRKNNTSC